MNNGIKKGERKERKAKRREGGKRVLKRHSFRPSPCKKVPVLVPHRPDPTWHVTTMQVKKS